ncbi:hypothetical protein [Williamsia sp. CHRR-6]|uniref:hypothetical protein n=1 Tax=Williamsia sp. CHRR-6 TaxID=2835871 RepID=UPI001BD96CE6|nr:hypothetical protein [Williamsia sp. CHRR-6]MBT0566194.1 hypothetical protein [Williamsia sp. CHRR-6]
MSDFKVDLDMLHSMGKRYSQTAESLAAIADAGTRFGEMAQACRMAALFYDVTEQATVDSLTADGGTDTSRRSARPATTSCICPSRPPLMN